MWRTGSPRYREDLFRLAGLLQGLRLDYCPETTAWDLAVWLSCGAAELVHDPQVAAAIKSPVSVRIRVHECRFCGVPISRQATWGAFFHLDVETAEDLCPATTGARFLSTPSTRTAGSDRYYARDVTSPFLLDDHLSVPTGPGLGVDPDPVFLDEINTSKEWIAL
jgi:hypothetical protein